MAQITRLPMAVCHTLVARGVPPDEAGGFLNPALRDLLPDPLSLRDMERAAARFLTAVESRQRIAIFADYDVDGGASAALLTVWLRAMGAEATLYIPDRIDEGYGPNGVAIMIECLSDNRNRSASEIKVAVTRNGGSMADLGSVSYLFNRKGVIIVNKVDGLTEDRVLEAVLDAGAEEVNDLGESFEVVCEPVDLVQVRTALQSAGIDYESADSSFLPSMSIPLDADGAKKVFELIDAIEELDDVQNVYSNFDVSDEVMASLE